MPRWSPVLVAAGLVLVATGVGIGIGVSGWIDHEAVVVGADFEVRGAGAADSIVPSHGFRAAEAVVPLLEVFESPGERAGTEPAATLPNPTHEGFPLTVSIIDDDGDDDPGGWLEVRLPQRPNGSTGWVRASDVRAWEVPNRIVVSIGERTLRVYQGDTDTVLFESIVAVGADRTPTPVGEFFIDIVNPLGDHPTYGWGQLSVAGYSEVLTRFEGGIGQIAIHGWNSASALGRNVSNGCVRMRNEDIARVAELSPRGTPVQIVA